MDEVIPTRIVVDYEEEIEKDEVFTNNDIESPTRSPSPASSPPPLLKPRSRRNSFRWTVESPVSAASPVNDDEDDPGTAFAKLVRTVQFIKKWAKRAEREPDSARDEFLDRFKTNGPSMDSAFGRPISEQDEEEVEERRGCYLWRLIKRRRHLVLIWNPSGHWLYRRVCSIRNLLYLFVSTTMSC